MNVIVSLDAATEIRRRILGRKHRIIFGAVLVTGKTDWIDLWDKK
jgi:hypothetical protein